MAKWNDDLNHVWLIDWDPEARLLKYTGLSIDNEVVDYYEQKV